MERHRRRASLLGFVASLSVLGCGATTLRVTAGPTLDTSGGAGFESLVSFGVGWPLDFHGRSHHYIQGRATLGGGHSSRAQKGVVIVGAELDYIHWAGSFDVRAGLHGFYRSLPDNQDSTDEHAFGGHVGIYPMVLGDGSGWLVQQLLIGPELRVEYLGTSDPAAALGHVSVPLVIEITLLGAGD
jgi:hypothetical protein